MEKAYKTFVAFSAKRRFNVMVYTNVSLYFIVTYCHEASRYLERILL